MAELHYHIDIISKFNTNADQQKEFQSALAGLPKQWYKGERVLIGFSRQIESEKDMISYMSIELVSRIIGQ